MKEFLLKTAAVVAVGTAALAGVSAPVEAKAPADPNCFGNTMSGVAKSGEMGGLVSSIATSTEGGFRPTVVLIKEGLTAGSSCPLN